MNVEKNSSEDSEVCGGGDYSRKLQYRSFFKFGETFLVGPNARLPLAKLSENVFQIVMEDYKFTQKLIERADETLCQQKLGMNAI